MVRRFQGAAIFMSVVAMLAAAACSPATGPANTPTGSGPLPTGSAAAPTDSGSLPTPAVGDARQIIETADPISPESIEAIEELRLTPAGEQAAREVLVAVPQRVDVAWAAAWVYASSASDPAPLRPLLGHSDASVRAIAAAGAVAMGDASGFEVVRALLGDDSQLRGSHPPLTVGIFAWATVSRYVAAAGVPAGPASADDMPGNKVAWSDWLTQNEAALQFDAARGTWDLP